MMNRIPLAWLQLIREKRRLLAALAGIAFAVMLMLMQLGFRDALFKSVTKMHDHLRADLVLISPQYEYLYSTKSFSQRRLYHALALESVESVAPLYVGLANWKNPETHRDLTIFVMAFDPRTNVFDLAGVNESFKRLQMPDTALFDSASRPEFGPVEERFHKNNVVFTEVNGRKTEVVGLFELGPSFGANGHLITSDLNFLRLFQGRKQGLIDLGLIRLKAGADPEKTRAQLAAALPNDILVLTRQGFIEREHVYWATNAPVGFVFNLGALLGMIVGAVIVYQILYTDVSDHLAEYATLKAMGYADRFLFRVVLHEAMILAVFGSLPGVAIAQGLYLVAQRATHLPIYMTLGRLIFVFFLTVFMCVASGALAMRKLRSADPAEIF